MNTVLLHILIPTIWIPALLIGGLLSYVLHVLILPVTLNRWPITFFYATTGFVIACSLFLFFPIRVFPFQFLGVESLSALFFGCWIVYHANSDEFGDGMELL